MIVHKLPYEDPLKQYARLGSVLAHHHLELTTKYELVIKRRVNFKMVDPIGIVQP